MSDFQAPKGVPDYLPPESAEFVAVRDGLLAGYYAEYRRRPQVDFIDTRGTAAGAIAAYDKAIAAGAEVYTGRGHGPLNHGFAPQAQLVFTG